MLSVMEYFANSPKVTRGRSKWYHLKAWLVFYSHFTVMMAVSVAVCEIFSVKEWRDLENWVGVVQGHGKWRRSTDHIRLSIGWVLQV